MAEPPAERSPRAALPSSQPAVLAAAACVVFAAWVATQYLAIQLRSRGYAGDLGPALYAAEDACAAWWRAGAAGLAIAGMGVAAALRGWRWARTATVASFVGAFVALVVSRTPVYTPLRGAVWAFRLRHAEESATAIENAAHAFAAALFVGAGLILAARPRRASIPLSASHGSARWSTGAEFLEPAGVLIGRLPGPCPPRRPGRARRADSGAPLLRYSGDGHLLTVAPTRSGKGVGCVIPNLLTYAGSALVTDPKGENFAVTARRRRGLGHTVRVLDPFRAVGGTDAVNPLDLVDPRSDDAVDDARLIADMLVVADGRAREPFWDEEARGILTGLTLHVAASAAPELRTLTHVRQLLTLPPEPFAELLKAMLESEAAGGLVARSAARVLQKADRERSGVISTAQSHTHFLDSPRMDRALGDSTFDFADLKRQRLSVYLVLPPERMDGYQRWLRLMIACAMLAMTRTPGQSRERVLFLLDEFAHLGRMQPVERDVGLVGGYGVTFWLLVQDLAQLRGTYPDKWQSFLANSDVLQAFGVNDYETADYLSKMLGDTTIHVASENRSAGRSRGRQPGWQEGAALTMAEKARRLLTSDEVLRLPAQESLLLVRGRHPIRARRLDYRVDPEFGGVSDPNPMYREPGIPSRSVTPR